MFNDIIEFIRVESPRLLLTIENFIGGRFESTSTHLDSFDPSTGRVWAKIPDSGAADVDKAVQEARRAFATWSKEPARKRSDVMKKVADLIEANLEILAAVESKDQGKPVALAKSVDIPRTILNFRVFANIILHEKNE